MQKIEMNDSENNARVSHRLIFGGSPPSILNLTLIGMTAVLLFIFFALMNLDLGFMSYLEKSRYLLFFGLAVSAAIGLPVCAFAVVSNFKTAKWSWLCVSIVQVPVHVGGLFIALANLWD